MVLWLPAAVARTLRQVLTHPPTYRAAVINFTLWGLSTAFCLIAVGLEFLPDGTPPSAAPPWLLLIRVGTGLLDAACLYWSALGWAAARAARDERRQAAADRAAFDEIARHF
jgi:hypothetical protein